MRAWRERWICISLSLLNLLFTLLGLKKAKYKKKILWNIKRMGLLFWKSFDVSAWVIFSFFFLSGNQQKNNFFLFLFFLNTNSITTNIEMIHVINNWHFVCQTAVPKWAAHGVGSNGMAIRIDFWVFRHCSLENGTTGNELWHKLNAAMPAFKEWTKEQRNSAEYKRSLWEFPFGARRKCWNGSRLWQFSWKMTSILMWVAAGWSRKLKREAMAYTHTHRVACDNIHVLESREISNIFLWELCALCVHPSHESTMLPRQCD